MGGAVIFASGFAELGEDGIKEQEAIARIANEAGMAVLGPNCLGFNQFRGVRADDLRAHPADEARRTGCRQSSPRAGR